jgi:hypothetical protein
MRFIPWFAVIGLASACLAQTSPAPKGPVDQLIPWLVFYLDPKLYVAGSRDSSFRTFYFEPKKSTNKVREESGTCRRWI